VYHVTRLGKGRSVIFWNDADRLRFLAQSADSLRLAGVVSMRTCSSTTISACCCARSGPTCRASCKGSSPATRSTPGTSSAGRAINYRFYPGHVSASKTQESVTNDVLKEYGDDLMAARRQYRAYTRACLVADPGGHSRHRSAGYGPPECL
jgi:hypothetical protein